MTFNDYYTITLSFQGNDLNFDPNTFSLALHESIWKFFSSATLTFADISGIYHERLLDTEGNVFSTQFGIKDGTTLSSKYVTTQSETPEVSTAGILGGNMNLSMLHEYYDKQTIINKAYTGRISDIVNTVVGEYNFSSIVKNDTGSNSTWYRLASTQKDFIEKVLLPNSYSTNAEYTPFFAYITTDNNFNFRNYKEMFDKSPSFTLTYQPYKQSDASLEMILNIVPYKVGSSKLKYARNRTILTRDYSDGSFISETTKITDYPVSISSSKKVSIVGDSSLITDYSYYNYTQSTAGEKEALIARKHFDERESYFVEKFLITTMFNPDIHVGQIVTIKASTIGTDSTVEFGLSQSGNYLVEDCIHSWEGLTKRKGYTYLIVSRKFMTTPNYLVKDLLIS